MTKRLSTKLCAATALFVLLFGLACDRDKPDQPARSTSSLKLPPGAVVQVKAAGITLDGKPAGSTDKITKLGRVHKLDGLFEKLKAKREQFKRANPGRDFPGKVVILAPTDTSLLVFKSAFQSSAYAGFPHVSVQTPSGFVSVEAWVPSPPDPTQELDGPPPKDLHVQLGKLEVTFAEKQGDTVVFESIKSRGTSKSEADLRALLTSAVVEHFKARKMSSFGRPDVLLHVDDELSFREATGAMVALEAAQRQLSADKPGEPAFELVFAVFEQLRSRHFPSLLVLDAGVPVSPDGGPAGRVRVGAVSVAGKLTPKVIERVVSSRLDRLRSCYEIGLAKNANLQGRIVVRFVVGADGMTSNVGGGGDLPDGEVVGCVTRQLYGLAFPKPHQGIVTVSYPVVFTPGR